tara:strand:- start:1382 stop:1564 length:183 start_codon:yes stop_codon:yes gene_type:complete
MEVRDLQQEDILRVVVDQILVDLVDQVVAQVVLVVLEVQLILVVVAVETEEVTVEQEHLV